ELAVRELLAERARRRFSLNWSCRCFDGDDAGGPAATRIPLACERLSHRGGVFGRRAAAASHDICARFDELARVLREVVGRRAVEQLAIDDTGKARVRSEERRV